jgi:cell shape-determining protein MreC
MKILFLILIFLVIGALFIISEKGFFLKNGEGIGDFFKSYSSWIGNLKENSKNVVGYISKLEWFPKE